MSTPSSDLTVSFEEHLEEGLKPLHSCLPEHLAEELKLTASKPEIRYGLLADISKWTRSNEGTAALKARHLDPSSYTMVSLLAGTTTSPSSRPPPYIAPESPEQKSVRELNDRKALTAVINGLLSVGCSGGAAWWAADKSGWRDEWKVLLALIVAAVVGISETILFILWQSPFSRSKRSKMLRNNVKSRLKKDDGDSSFVTTEENPTSVSPKGGEGGGESDVRRRMARKMKDDAE